MSMAEILRDLDAAFLGDENIDEIGILMVDSPPNIIVADHKVGLPMSVLKPLFRYAIGEFHATLKKLAEGDGSVDHAREEDGDRLLSLTRAILVVKGDMPMAFNVRKKLISSLTHRVSSALIQKELLYLKALFTKHPKSPSSWEHRRWCLKHRASARNHTTLTPREDENWEKVEIIAGGFNFLGPQELKEELSLCSSMAEVYSKNYYAWLHRLWLLQHMSAQQLQQEVDDMKVWLQSHVSDHCASSHRQQALLKLLSRYSEEINPEDEDGMFDSFTRQVDAVERVLASSGELISSRAGYEALWYHRRTLADLLLERVATFLPTVWAAIATSTAAVAGVEAPVFPTIASLTINDPPKNDTAAGNTVVAGFATYLQRLRISSNNNSNDNNNNNSSNSNNSSSSSSPADTTEVAVELKYSSLAQCVYSWLIDWILQEAEFCRRNAHGDASSWDPTRQRQLSLRYWCYLLERLVRRLGDHVVLLQGGTVIGGDAMGSTTATAGGARGPAAVVGRSIGERVIHPQQTAVSIPTCTLHEVTSYVRTSSSSELLHRADSTCEHGTGMLVRVLIQALHAVSNVLLQEDPLERCWKQVSLDSRI